MDRRAFADIVDYALGPSRSEPVPGVCCCKYFAFRQFRVACPIHGPHATELVQQGYDPV